MSITNRLKRGLYVITDHQHLDFSDLLACTKLILETGISALQYRNKHDSTMLRLQQATALHTLCRGYHTPFLINDDIELALAINADGLHIGRDDVDCITARQRLGDDCLIGVSCYNEYGRMQAAVRDGADYVAFGAMYPTASKQNTVSAHPDLITRTRNNYDIPIVAIGGITPNNCLPIIKAGADLLAVISSVYLSDDPADTVARFNSIIIHSSQDKDISK